jgi:SAM-dependent methyltransferase
MKKLDVCPVCTSRNIRFSYQGKTTRDSNDPNQWQLYECLDCSLGFVNPQPNWDDLQAYYSSLYPPYQASHGLREDEERVLAQARIDGEYRGVKITPGQSLLDVGCGAGSFIGIMEKLGLNVQGIEPSNHGYTGAQSRGLSVFHGTLEEYCDGHVTDHRFNIITSSHVLEHVPNPVEVLSLMGKLLAPNGIIWIAVPHAKCVFARRLKDRWHSTDLPYHILQFSSKSFDRAAENAGLKVRRQYTISPDYAVASSIRLYLRHQWLFPRAISERIQWIDNTLAPWLARRLDAQVQGETLITELELAN